MTERRVFISNIGSHGDWIPLLSRLGWTRKNALGSYGDGGSIFDSDYRRHFVLYMNSFEGIEDTVRRELEGGYYKNIVQSPSGLKINVFDDMRPTIAASPYIANHVAVTVDDVAQETEWWRRILNCDPVLSPDEEYDPIIDGPLTTRHFYRQRDLYVTLREPKGDELPGKIHHLGWETETMDAIDAARDALQEIGWPIVWEGEIDQSYVLHFQGPDDRIHDFFYVTPELKETAAQVTQS